MQSGNGIRWNFRNQLTIRAQRGWFTAFFLGLFLAIIAVSMWQQWSLTFGQDPEFLLASALVICIVMGARPFWQNRQSSISIGYSLPKLICCLTAWTVLHPFWIDALTRVMANVPLSTIETPVTKWLVLLPLAFAGWTIPALLCRALIGQLGHLASRGVASGGSSDGEPSASNGTSFVLCGVAFGLVLDSVWLTSWFGVYVPAVAVSVVACIVSWWSDRTMFVADSRPLDPSRVTSGQFLSSSIYRCGMVCLVGGLLACNLRLSNQLMPHAAFVFYVQLAGVLLGAGAGFWLGTYWTNEIDRTAFSGLIAAAASSLLLAIQLSLVDGSIWLNSSLTTVFWLMIARITLLTCIAFPFGLSFAGIAGTRPDQSNGWLTLATPFAASWALTGYLLGGAIGLVPTLSIGIVLLLVSSVAIRIGSMGWSVSVRKACVAACLVLASLSFPLWSSHDDAARTAKLLFSTPAFMAYRFGWDLEHLPYLDDIRMIDRIEGRTGPLTLWRGRVAELYIREAGIPRAVVSKAPDLIPQFTPEVLQAVYSLVISDRPDRVLLLGLSGGVPLSTCLNFPIRELVCVEGDSQLIELVRGPLARETGNDPLTDDRVTLHQGRPELALMTKSAEKFDVVLSSPPSSSLVDGTSSFTQEFYQRVSRQLAERGLFCQRVECLDYGPEPLQLIVKTMQSAFSTVMAIETSPGEFLLFGANTESVFIPSDLAARLETTHVCKVLARSGIDWSGLLDQPAYDHAALMEIAEKYTGAANSVLNGNLAAKAPGEVMRWGNKRQECQNLLTSQRISIAPYSMEENDQSGSQEEVRLSLRSRLADWLGDANLTKELKRRLGEVATQQRLVRENPDAHWWAYRKTLRKQLQENPRTAVQQVKAVDDSKTLHPEDARRRDYFVALGNAARQSKPTRESISAVEEFLEPYDPLISLFARQETADLLGRAQLDPGRELEYRMYVIYYAPVTDASVRNVATAIETLVKHPETILDPSFRFDALNGLIQTLRVRWEIRQSIAETSARKVLQDIDQSLIAVEKGIAALDTLAPSAGISEHDWESRKQVFERLMQRPLRTYRSDVQSRMTRGEAQAKALIDEASKFDDEDL